MTNSSCGGTGPGPRPPRAPPGAGLDEDDSEGSGTDEQGENEQLAAVEQELTGEVRDGTAGVEGVAMEGGTRAAPIVLA